MAKKKNFIVRYFSNFGIKQISEILLFIGMVALIVSLFFTEQVEFAKIFMGITLAVVAFASALCVVRHVLIVVNKKINRRSPEFKHAVIALVASAILFALCVFGSIYAFVA